MTDHIAELYQDYESKVSDPASPFSIGQQDEFKKLADQKMERYRVKISNLQIKEFNRVSLR